MTAEPLELAAILRDYTPAFLDAYGDRISPEQRRVLRDLVRCRTAELGGHVEQCDGCGHQRNAYNSCRNRHCPKCQAAARAEWLDERAAELLATEYFHVVFTLPADLGPVALQNPRLVYGTLLQASAQSLLQLARDPKHLGADIGFLAVLHTWGQNLHLHPHVHCVVPGGGIALAGDRWLSCRPDFFLPVRPLGRLFRGKFLAMLQRAYERGLLGFHGQQQHLADPLAFRELMASCWQKEWVVYAKPPFGGPEQVLKYLARYTHRVAISNQRLVKVEEGQVFFRWKDYAQGNQQKVMALEAVEFIRRFLLHVVPSGFVRIRHYGLLGNRVRAENLARCRVLLGMGQVTAAGGAGPSQGKKDGAASGTETRCPVCGQGRMVRVSKIEPADPDGTEEEVLRVVAAADTS
ncbi:MAG TPA: IS91 family transposase [Gemmataceae bacterium]|nr:IS91 family transposase [Gemmataceae bacterium]